MGSRRQEPRARPPSRWSRRAGRRLANASWLLLPLLTGCLASVSPTVSGVVDRARPGEEPLRLHYLGNGGWILSHGEDVVLTGPLFSNPSLASVVFGSIRPDTMEVDRYLSPYEVSQAGAILVGHAHYDHLLDVPRTAKVHAPEARIVGSRTVANLLGTWSGLGDRVDPAEPHAGDVDAPGTWMRYGDVRVMPLRSHHGPHYSDLTLFVGSIDRPHDRAPEWARDWVDGETYAFLVDFMAGPDSVAFRVYYQDAVAEPPFGLAPDALISERPVDVAILVPSTFEEVPWHPEALIANLRPRRVLLGHWEDFFNPVSGPIKPSPMTDHSEFDRRLQRVFTGEWWRPDRWTEFRFGRD